MSFIPKNIKFPKVQKKKIKNLTSTNTELVFGTVGLKIAENGFLTSKQLDMLKLLLSKSLKKQGQYWIRVFSHFPVTSKPLEVRMGKGKGYVDKWICKLKVGVILCEISGLSLKNSIQILKKISLKLPLLTIFVSKVQC